MRHDGSHGDDCFGCRIKTVAISAEAMPTRHPHEARSAQKEREWAKDHDAYRRLHHDGITPDHIDGAAAVETLARNELEATHMDMRPGWSEP